MTAFFDTNILVYAFLDLDKRAPALRVLAQGGVISAQVLNEFTHVAHRKRKRTWSVIEAAVAAIRIQFPIVQPLTAETHASAIALARGHTLSFYDALIVAAALTAGCDTLYSEDLQNGRAFEGLTIINPFTT